MIADREVEEINFGLNDNNNNESSQMLAGSMVGGAVNQSIGGGGGVGGSGILGGKSGEGGGHAPLRRPRVSPTTSLFMTSRGRSPSSARSESKTGASLLPRYRKLSIK